MNLLIKNGILVSPEGRYQANIAVQDGKTAVIMANFSCLEENNYDKVIDAKGLYVLPGCMDPHVHFRDPGHTNKEDFFTGSAAAAAGGFTTVYDMPNNMPRTLGKKEFDEKMQIIGNRSHVDFALYGLVSDNLENLPELMECGVRGFKGLMGISSMKTPTCRDATLWQALKLLKDTGYPISVHAEETEICDVEKERLMKEGRNDARAHMESRPAIAEIIAVQRAIMLAEDIGGRLHIAHISAKETVEIIRAAKARGVRVTCETGPHNLLFTDADYGKIGQAMFMNPPIRCQADQDALYAGIMDGTVDMLATDHAPHTEEDKFSSGHMLKSVSGCCSIESSVAVMLTLVNQGKLTLEQYVKLASTNVAKLFNLYPQKGCIAVGSDADFTIVDMEREGVIRKEALHSKTKVTMYDGLKVKGMPVYTIIRGNVVMKDGVVMPGAFGQLVK